MNIPGPSGLEENVPVLVEAEVELATPPTPEDPGDAGTCQIRSVMRDGVNVQPLVDLAPLEVLAIEQAKRLCPGGQHG